MKNLDWEDVFKWTSPVWYLALLIFWPVSLIQELWKLVLKDLWFIFFVIQRKDAYHLDESLKNYHIYQAHWTKERFRKWKTDYMVKKIIKLKLKRN